MIGQKSLLSKIDAYTLDTFPKTSIFIGERGMGKHTLVEYIRAAILKLPVEDLSETLSDVLLEAIYRRPLPEIYLVDLSAIDERKQNVLLKFIEEPPVNAFTILLAERDAQVLDTVLNRCIKFEFTPYTKEELRSFVPENIDVDLVLSALHTPGKIKSSNLAILQETADYAERIATKLPQASYANTLSIVNKINFKDEYNKFDLEILLNMLENSLFKHYLDSNDTNIYALYKLLVERKKTLLDKRINKESFIESLLTTLWLNTRSLHE